MVCQEIDNIWPKYSAKNYIEKIAFKVVQMKFLEMHISLLIKHLVFIYLR